MLANSGHPGLQAELSETRSAAARLGLSLQYVPVASTRDFVTAFDAITAGRAQALIAFPDTLINAQAAVIADFAARRRLPTVSGWTEFTQAGNLMSYGPILGEFYRSLAGHVDKLLKGAKAADLPVEQPTRFELVLNLKVAKQLGLTIPQSLLLRADEVIQ